MIATPAPRLRQADVHLIRSSAPTCDSIGPSHRIVQLVSGPWEMLPGGAIARACPPSFPSCRRPAADEWWWQMVLLRPGTRDPRLFGQR
jgi:hypothetical protein